MIHFLFVEDNILMNNYISTINNDDKTVIELEITKENCTDCFNKLIEYDLFNTKKILVFKHIDFFYSKKSSLKEAQINNCITKLNNHIHDVVIILNKELSEANKYYKQITTSNKYKSLESNVRNKNNYIKKFIELHSIDISSNLLKKVVEDLDNDLYSIQNELIKLSTYENPITIKTIELLSYKNIKSSVFLLMELILSEDYKKAKDLYNKLQNEGSEPVSLVASLATQVKFIYQVAFLMDYNSSKIANRLKVSEYRINMTKNKIALLSNHIIKEKYLKIAEVDYLIKRGTLNPEQAIDYILL